MSLEQLVRDAIRNDPALSAVHGGRVYANRQPQRGTKPSIVYHRISGQPVNSLEKSALQNARFQIDAWATKYDDIHGDFIDNLVTAMQSADGFRAIVIIPPMDEYEPDTELYRVTTDFSVWLR